MRKAAANQVHNHGKNPLVLPADKLGRRMTVAPGKTCDLDDDHAAICSEDPGFKNWVKAKLIGPPPKDDADDTDPDPPKGGKGKASDETKG